MIQALDKALGQLQLAADARALYPAGHPSIAASAQAALALLQQVLAGREQVTVFQVDDRVVCDNQPLPSSAPLGENLFRRLRRQGADGLTLRRGLNESELAALLEQLAAPPPGSPGSPGSPRTDPGARASSPAQARPAENAGEDTRAPGVAPGSPGTTGAAATPAQPPAHPGPHVQWRRIEGQGSSVPTAASTGPISPAALTSLNPAQQALLLRCIWQNLARGQKSATESLGQIVSGLTATVCQNRTALLSLARVKEFDDYTFVHTVNVALLSTAMAQAAGLSGQLLHDLAIAALLHDIGKLAVPRRVLNQKDALTDQERQQLMQHPVDGARILLGSGQVPTLAPIVAFEHHLGVDGKGYPRVPPQWRVNAASQMVRICDVYDALRTDRPYRAGLGREQALETMHRGAGTMFDPALLECFMTHVLPRSAADQPATPAVPAASAA